MTKPRLDFIESLFPLPLTPFETYMAMDNKPDYPSSTSTRFVFRGSIDREKFEQAFYQAAASEPAFYMRLNQNKSRYFWTADVSTPLPLIFETSDVDFTQETTGEIPFVSFDIIHQPGVFFRVIEGTNSIALDFRNHHCIGDGIGMNAFIGNWLDCYGQLIAPEPDWQPYKIDVNLFTDREKLFRQPDTRTFFQRVKAFLGNVVPWLVKKPWEIKNQPQTPPCLPITQEPKPEQIQLPIARWYVFSGEQLKKYREAAKKQNVSMNTFLIRDVFLTIRQWSELFSRSPQKNELFRVLMPRNLRNEHHAQLPCTDLVGYTFFDCTPQQCNYSSDFLKYIDDKTRHNSNVTLFLKALKLFLRVPGFFRMIVSRKCLCTAVISNVGRVNHIMPQKRFLNSETISVPGLELVRLIGSPLCRPGTPVSMGISTCGDETTITFTIDVMHLNKISAETFVNTFFAQLEKSINQADAN